MSTVKANKYENTSTSDGGISIDNSGHVTVDGQQLPTAGALSNRNILINGDCRVQQRTTASQSHSSAGSVFGVDRFYAYATQASKVTVQQNQASVTPPVGFQKYLGITSSSAYTSLSTDVFSFGQVIEAQNAAQLAWGTADARAITLSFWVRSSLTGTHSGAIMNGSFNRSYPYSYTISSADTWEYKTITVPGDTSGTWDMAGNGKFAYIIWDYGTGSDKRGTAGAWTGSHKEGVTGAVQLVGTSGATWYITGIQLEVGEKATPFEHRSYADEFQKCLRYHNMVATGSSYPICNMQLYASNNFYGVYHFPVAMRAAPTVDATDVTDHFVLNSGGSSDNFDTIFLANSRTTTVEFRGTSSEGLSGRTAGHAAWARTSNAAAFIGLSSEL